MYFFSKMNKAFLLLAAVGLLWAGCAKQNPLGPKVGSRMSALAVNTQGKITEEAGCFQGVFLGGTAGNPFGLDRLPGFETQTGKGVRIIAGYIAWGANTDFPQADCQQIIAHGSYPLITWEPWNYAVADSNWTNQAVISGQYDAYILRWANAIRAWGQPVFIRLMHEMNGNWYPWAVNFNGNSYDSYRQAWQHVVTLFNQAGATQVTWVWCPNQENVPFTNNMADCYPGDSYVDWTGMTGYNWGNTQAWSAWKPFSDIFSSAYQTITSITGKPVLLSGFASTEFGGNKAAWIADALGTPLMANFPRVRGLYWFNEMKETNWQVDSSPESLAAYQTAVANPYFLPNQGAVPVVPVISGVSAEQITGTSAVIRWTTQIPADSAVDFGTSSGNLNLRTANATLTLSHSLALTGLRKKTTYYYRVSSTAQGQTAASALFELRTANR